MGKEGPAVIRVTAVGGHPVHLGWTSSILVPADVEIEFVDFGSRVECVVTRRDEQVGVVCDLDTGERAFQTNGHPASLVARLALACVDARQAYGSTSPDRKQQPSPFLPIAAIAELGGAEYVQPASARYPLPSELRTPPAQVSGAPSRPEDDE